MALAWRGFGSARGWLASASLGFIAAWFGLGLLSAWLRLNLARRGVGHDWLRLGVASARRSFGVARRCLASAWRGFGVALCLPPASSGCACRRRGLASPWRGFCMVRRCLASVWRCVCAAWLRPGFGPVWRGVASVGDGVGVAWRRRVVASISLGVAWRRRGLASAWRGLGLAWRQPRVGLACHSLSSLMVDACLTRPRLCVTSSWLGVVWLLRGLASSWLCFSLAWLRSAVLLGRRRFSADADVWRTPAQDTHIQSLP